MATNIEWTNETWNPIAGCSRVSEGCRHCYAEKMAKRLAAMGQAKYEGLTVLQGSHTVWTGKISFDSEMLFRPCSWKKPRRIFVNSMSDLFHENVTDHMRDQVFAVMALCARHTFQILTKRPEDMLRYMTSRKSGEDWAHALSELNDADDLPVFGEEAECAIANAINGVMAPECNVGWPMRNVWLGVSVENQKAADERIPLLLQTPAAVRFISAEPLLGPVNLRELASFYEGSARPLLRLDSFTGEHECGGQAFGPAWGKLDWVIVGGESGPGARPMHPDWARSLRDQCQAAGVPFFFKQWGEWAPTVVKGRGELGMPDADWDQISDRVLAKPQCAFGNNNDLMLRVGKKAAGHRLDGEVIQQFPEVRA